MTMKIKVDIWKERAKNARKLINMVLKPFKSSAYYYCFTEFRGDMKCDHCELLPLCKPTKK